MNEKDKELALSIPLGVSCVCGIAHEGSVCDWHQQIADALTAVRQEERRAALERHAGAVCGFCERGNPVQFIAEPNCFKHQLEGETPWTTCRANDVRMVERALEAATNETKGEAGDAGSS